MTDTSTLAGLSARASHVFSLAGELGRSFHEEVQSRAVFIDPASWPRLAPTFNEFCTALLDLREAMQDPPDGFGPVADRLMQAAKLAKGIRETLARNDAFSGYLDFFPELNTVSFAGFQAVKEATKARRLDDPFAFVDQPAATPVLSLLDRFPATLAGHLPFLEWVRDEVHQAAEAKRGQMERGYSNATIESMVGGIKWAEARQRLAALTSLPADMREQVARALGRDLTPGTVERIDELLTPAVRGLREGRENRDRLQELQAGGFAMDLTGMQSTPNLEGDEFGPATESSRCTKRDGSAQKGESGVDKLPLSRLLSVFSNGVADERIRQASLVLQDNELTTNEKLEKIDGLLPFPSTASAEQLARMFEVTKQAVMKTTWWKQNRKGQTANEIGRRRNVHKQRASQLDPTEPNDEKE